MPNNEIQDTESEGMRGGLLKPFIVAISLAAYFSPNHHPKSPDAPMTVKTASASNPAPTPGKP